MRSLAVLSSPSHSERFPGTLELYLECGGPAAGALQAARVWQGDSADGRVAVDGYGLGDPSLAFRVPSRVGLLAAWPAVRVDMEGHGVALLVYYVVHCIVDLFGVPQIARAAVIGPAAS